MPLFPRQLRSLVGADPVQLVNTTFWYQKTGIAPIYTSATWSTANLAVYTPIVVEDVRKINAIMLLLGATPSGLAQCALYEADSEGKPGVQLATTIPTIQSPANEFQTMYFTVPFDTEILWIGPGTYYLACVFNNTSGTVTRLVALTTDGDGPVMGGIFTEANAYPLPAVATPSATPVTVNVPVMGLTY